MKLDMRTVNRQKTTLLLPSSSFCPTPAVLLLLPSSNPAPPQVTLNSCLAPALFLLRSVLLLPCSCFYPALALLRTYSWSAPAHPSLAAFIIISTLRLFSVQREQPFLISFMKVEQHRSYRVLRICKA